MNMQNLFLDLPMVRFNVLSLRIVLRILVATKQKEGGIRLISPLLFSKICGSTEQLDYHTSHSTPHNCITG